MNVTRLPIKMNAKQAEQLIKTIAVQSSNVRFAIHALERMKERAISLANVYEVLCKGYVDGIPTQGKKEGEWKCKIVRHARGNRDIGVIVIIIRGSTLFVKTVEWEDL